MSSPQPIKPVQVPEQTYRGQKSKFTKALNRLDELLKHFTDGKVVENQDDKDALKQELRNAETALAEVESYLLSHNAHEAKQQESNAEYVDKELTRQQKDHDVNDKRYSESLARVGEVCREFNTAQAKAKASRRRSPSESISPHPNAGAAGGSTPNKEGRRVVILKEDEATKMSDALRPDKLSDNADIMTFLNWIRSVEAFWELNHMKKKTGTGYGFVRILGRKPETVPHRTFFNAPKRPRSGQLRRQFLHLSPNRIFRSQTPKSGPNFQFLS